MKERFTTLKSGCDGFNRWQKKYPNPLDLATIHHSENLRLKDNNTGEYYYINIKAMSENMHKLGRIAFIGLTIRKNDNFILATREEENEIKKFLDDKLSKISKDFNCSYTRAE